MKANNTPEDAQYPAVGLRERLSFGLGDYGTNLTYTLMVTFLAYYYTDVVGVSAFLVGSLMFLARIIDGVVCIGVGIRIDKTQSRYGKARPWVLWTAVPFGLSTFLLACVPDTSYALKISWVCVTYLLVNILFTANNIAYGSLLALITRDPVERGMLSVFRKGLSTCGSLTVGVITLPLIGWLGSDNHAWLWVFALYGSFTAIFLMITGLGTRERIKPVREDNRDRIAFRRVRASVLANKYWIMIFFYLMITFTSLTAMSTVSVYYSKYILQDISLMSWISVAQYLPGLLTLLVIPFLIKRIGKRNLALLGLTICCVAFLLPLLDRHNAAFVIAATVVRSIGFCGIGATMFAFLADTIDYGEWKTGLRIEGILFSAGTLGQTVGMGLGSASVGWMLSAAGFSSGGGSQPESAFQMIQFLFIFFPLILAGLNMALLCFYRLDGLYHQVSADLTQGKFADSASEPVAGVQVVS
jgi:GPH family glycoside/pentoside/hexuronide:cation symporter